MTSKAPKIVQIETRYVETDAINFRDVVQSLTGKNSSTAWIGRNEGSDVKGGIDAVPAKPEKSAASNGTKETHLSSMLMNNTSFKEFDRLWFEFPNIEMEDMPWL
ncbi:VQ motif-containing protein 10-like [Gastrolobium bilobum]|uniref:VQ motif-containing protein 10-like n=1 Tax=Gastrolobium bilobum TaxID=150636 RepID=UPI002AB0CFEB|nr:VQ motif-containing protein 10-like [Gastrolobium bilobum]